MSGEKVPTWMSLSEAAKACFKLTKSKSKNVGKRFKCCNANIPCTESSQCSCEKYVYD